MNSPIPLNPPEVINKTFSDEPEAVINEQILKGFWLWMAMSSDTRIRLRTQLDSMILRHDVRFYSPHVLN